MLRQQLEHFQELPEAIDWRISVLLLNRDIVTNTRTILSVWTVSCSVGTAQKYFLLSCTCRRVQGTPLIVHVRHGGMVLLGTGVSRILQALFEVNVDHRAHLAGSDDWP